MAALGAAATGDKASLAATGRQAIKFFALAAIGKALLDCPPDMVEEQLKAGLAAAARRSVGTQKARGANVRL